ncbi:MAG: tetratricopeptide repeat protein [Phycisphaerae bacterium]|nr:tetratricopeptide repeat protein [Phycisphaerae bacterium]
MTNSLLRVTRAAVVAILVAATNAAPGQENLSASAWVDRGNLALQEQRWDDALEAYRRADVAQPETPEIAYNRGVALYRKGDFDKAREAFGDALRTRDPALEAKAKFNLGNCAYATALGKLNDLPGAIEELTKALNYYRDSLQLNPDDREARQNIEMAQLLMKDLIDKEKKRQEEEQKKREEQEKQNPQSQPTSQPQEQQEQQQDPSKQEKQEQKKESDESKDPQDEPQQDPSQRQPKDQKNAEQKQQAGQPREIKREEAERQLQAIRDKERARRDDRRRREMLLGGRAPVERDW